MTSASHKASAAQATLASRLRKHNATMAQRNPMQTEAELPLSMEMIELLDRKFSDIDEHGCLPDGVSSVLALPMSGISTFCPTAAILESKNTASRMPDQREIEDDALTRRGFSADSFDRSFSPTRSPSSRFQSTRFGGFPFEAQTNDFHDMPTSPATHFSALPTDAYRQSGMLSPSQYKGQLPGTPKIHDSKSRLEVMWLQRKAELAREDGKSDLAVQLLQEAIDEHLGTTNYSSAGLADPIISSNPHELLDNIDNVFYIYDEPVHLQVAKVQRCFHKKFVRKARMVTHIARAFRGFMARKRMRKHKDILRQCAVLVQRRFRIHLERMHRLATKIKTWFWLMKIVHNYKKRLHIYCMARRIQRLFRGKKGRARAAYFRLRLRSNMCIQRTLRAYAVRRDRAFAIQFFHRIYFDAARVIQHFVRRKQAIERAQMKLLIELAKENVRARKERIVVDEAIRMQKIWDNFYTKSAPGKANLEHLERQMRVQKMGLQEVKVELTEDELVSQRAINVLEQYDEDGTGNIYTKRLEKVLQRLCIAANHEKLLHVRSVLDPDDIGYVSITDFMEWFESEDADEFLEPDSVIENIQRLRLEVRRKLRALHIQRNYRKLRKEHHRKHSSWLTKDTINTFRFTHPPKFQCCQCLQAFAMFTDYFLHFDRTSGCCGVTGLKALYFPQFWVSADWAKQRQIEAEIIRVNDEHPFVKHNSRKRCFADISLRLSPPMRRYNRLLLSKAYELYKDDYIPRSLTDLKDRTVQDVEQLVTTCSGKSVSDFGIDVIMRSLSLPVNSQWIIEEFATGEELKQWLDDRLPMEMASADTAAGTAVTSKAAKVEGSSKKGSPSKKNNKKNQKVSGANKTSTVSNDQETNKGIPYSSNLLFNFRTPRFTDTGKIKRRCWEMAFLHVSFLRIMQIEAQASLMSLIEFRSRRPRRITISDSELEHLELFSLRGSHYASVQKFLIERLRSIDQLYVKLHSKTLPRKCAPLKTMFSRYQPIEPVEARISRDRLFAHAIDAAHAFARAQNDSRVKSPIGRLVLRHLARDLKTNRHLLLSEALNGNADEATITTTRNARTEISEKFDMRINNQSGRSFSSKMLAIGQRRLPNPLLESLDLLFIYGKYCSAMIDEGIDRKDLLLIANQFALRIPDSDLKMVLDQLDPEGTGYVSYKWFVAWLQSPQKTKFNSTYLRLRNYHVELVRYLLRRKYCANAKDALLTRMRSITRMEVIVRENIVRSGINDDQLHAVMRNCLAKAESGDVGAVLNSRRFHDMHSQLDFDEMQRRVEELNELYAQQAVNKINNAADPTSSVIEAAATQEVVEDLISMNDACDAENMDSTENEHQQDDSANNPNADGIGDGDREEPDSHERVDDDIDIRSADDEQVDNVVVSKEDSDQVDGQTTNVQKAPSGLWGILPFRRKPTSADAGSRRPSALADRLPNKYIPPLQGSLYENWTKWFVLRWKEEDAEHKVFYNLVEDHAEARFWRDLFGRVGRYNVLTEQLLLHELDEYIDALGYCFSPISSDKMINNNFEERVVLVDTNCDKIDPLIAADFDESLSEDVLSASCGPQIVDGSTTAIELDAMQQEIPLINQDRVEGSLQAGEKAMENSSIHDHINGSSISASNRFSNSQHWGSSNDQLLHTALERIISTFDTDCTGDFDEVEVRTVLKCLYCTLSERMFRSVFGGTDDMPTCVSVHELIDKLSARVRWVRPSRHFPKRIPLSFASGASVSTSDGLRNSTGLQVKRHNSFRCAISMLTTIQRQRAQQRAMQTVKLSRMGKVVMLREERAGTSFLTLLHRAQLLSMRQTKMFLTTTHGLMKLHFVMMDVEFSWQQDIVAPYEGASICTAGVRAVLPGDDIAPSDVDGGTSRLIAQSSSLNDSNSLFRYAYMLHREERGVLVTELPHCIKFLITRFRLQANQDIAEKLKPYLVFRGVGGIIWLNYNQFLSIVKPLFVAPEWPPTSTELSHVPYRPNRSEYSVGSGGKLKKRIRYDSILRMHSVARQQAVLISMNFQNINVPETNYRCSVLGLHLFIQRHLGFTMLKSKKIPGVILSARDARFEMDVDWAFVPREATAIYLLARGYSFADLAHPSLAPFVEVEHQHGNMCNDLVPVAAMYREANHEIARKSSYFEQMLRTGRYMTRRFILNREYKRVVRAMVLYSHRVDKLGADFLKEILLGVSHCQEK